MRINPNFPDGRFEKTKPILWFRVQHQDQEKLFEKTKPIYSYRVLRAAYCENEFEKTKPICAGIK